MIGIAASPGIVIGKAYLFEKIELDCKPTKIDQKYVDYELDRLCHAKKKTKKQLEKLYEETKEKVGQQEAAIFDTHMMLMDDPILEHKIKGYITDHLYVAETATNYAMNDVKEMFEALDDAYLRERAVDVVDVCSRLIYNLAEVEIMNLQDLDEEVIVIANDLTPSDTASMNFEKVLGFATDMGGKTAHTAIMARTLELPAVVGLKVITHEVENGDMVILDGTEGTVIIHPSDEDIRNYQLKRQQLEEEKKALEELIHEEAITLDGKTIEIAANIGMPKDMDSVLRYGAQAIGLYRTEFLYMDQVACPTESEQFDAYKIVAEKMGAKPVVIRTLDIGGDKSVDYLKLPHEMNPFLGYRAIRMCLDREELFKTQLKAILRASHYGKIRIMYPMITHMEQVQQANTILEQAKAELIDQHIPFDKNIEVGIMIETPGAAMMADLLIKEVDFFSIGTNDLTQYTLAVDRGNEKINYLYSTFHPGVLRLIKKVIDASHKEGKWTGMCGEFAGNEKAAVLLLGLGLDELSMSAVSMMKVKDMIRRCTYSSAKEMAHKLLDMAYVNELEHHLDDYIDKHIKKEG
ncbi:phosphoenolpyruvate--protein phosphotransferase [Vallitalea pronyensis]|nr:phosphoenolpyruvate--protein phosphotransferase [Vallitalea pronyensis]